MNRIKGIGIDLVKVNRFDRLINKYEEGIIKKILHNDEIKVYKEIIKERKAIFLASRWACKEALVKATGDKSIVFSKVNIHKDSSNRPSIQIDLDHSKERQSLQDVNLHVSLSHELEYTTAIVLAEYKENLSI